MLLILWIPFAQTTGHHSTTWGFRDSSATFDGVPSDEVLGPSGCTSNRVPDALNIAMETTVPYFARKLTVILTGVWFHPGLFGGWLHYFGQPLALKRETHGT